MMFYEIYHSADARRFDKNHDNVNKTGSVMLFHSFFGCHLTQRNTHTNMNTYTTQKHTYTYKTSTAQHDASI